MFRAGDREVAGRIAQALLLFQGMIVFFVDDDETDIRHGCEDGRARTDDELRGP